VRDIETSDSELRLVAVLHLAAGEQGGPTAKHSIVLCAGFLTGGFD
jgi:hypothetical protein